MRSPLFLALLLLLRLPAFCQDSVDFKTVYQPEHMYTTTSVQKTTTRISLDSGGQEIIDAMKEHGVELPMVKTQSVNSEFQLKTGKQGDSARMPVFMDIVKCIDDSGKAVIPAGSRIFGSVHPSDLPALDSMHAPDMDEDVKASFMKMMKDIFSQLSLPAVKVAVGQTIGVDNPVKLPFPGMDMNMKVHMDYTLTGLTGNIAHFDVAMKINFQLSGTEAPLSGGGTGAGTVLFDTKNYFMVGQDLHMSVDMFMRPQPGTVMHIQVKTETSSSVSVEPHRWH